MSAPIALDPSVGGFSVGYDGLQAGDIIVSTTTAGISLGIRIGTGAVVSHAALYCGSGSVIEAIGQGVVSRSIDDSLAGDALAVAYRSPDMTLDIAASIIEYASAQIGDSYDVYGAVASANLLACLIRGVQPAAFFCSELIIDAYQRGGLPLGTLPPQCYTPGDIAQIGIQRLIYAGHLKGDTSWFPVLSP